ncbi:MAG: hypothetical protein ACXVCY_07655 [Pseudobdellovibrionaceae bacterium]
MGNEKDDPIKKLNHDLKELSFWLHTLDEALEAEGSSEPVQRLAGESVKRIDEIIKKLKSSD